MHVDNFPQNFSRLLKEQNYTQEKFAERIGCSHVMVGLYQRGLNTPRAPKMQMIADTLGITIDQLFAPIEQSDE